jgi:hypothetical protein
VIGAPQEKPIAVKCGREMSQARLIQSPPGGVTALHQGAAMSYA